MGHAGSALLIGTADRLGLTRLLSQAIASTRKWRSAHDPGVVLRGLAVMLADGGDCLGDLGALRDQLDLYGNVASDATAFRVIDSIDEQALMRLRSAVATARAGVDARGAAGAYGRERGGASGADGARHRRDAHDRAFGEGAGARQLQGRLRPSLGGGG